MKHCANRGTQTEPEGAGLRETHDNPEASERWDCTARFGFRCLRLEIGYRSPRAFDGCQPSARGRVTGTRMAPLTLFVSHRKAERVSHDG
jgi:hypothetical protein